MNKLFHKCQNYMCHGLTFLHLPWPVPPVQQTGTTSCMYDEPDIVAHRTKITGVGSSTPMGAAGYDFEPKHMHRGPPPKLSDKRDELVISQSVSLWLLSCQHFPSFLSRDLCPGLCLCVTPTRTHNKVSLSYLCVDIVALYYSHIISSPLCYAVS